MASRTDNVVKAVVVSRVTDGRTESITNSVVELARRVSTKTDTVKRPKPSDLMLNATSFYNTSVHWAVAAPLVRSQQSAGKTQFVFDYPSFENDSPPLGYSNFGALDHELLSTIKDQKVNLAVSVAELGEATDMSVVLARNVYNAFHSLRSGRAFSDFVRNLQKPHNRSSRAIARKWLEYTYGWVPLMHDIYGLSEEIGRKVEQGLPITVRCSRHYTVKDSFRPYPTVRALRSGNGVKTAKARYMVDNTGFRRASQIGITNPASVAWELVPYSFVIDWVIDIGGYLNTLDALVGVKNLVVTRGYGYNTQLARTFSISGVAGWAPWKEESLGYDHQAVVVRAHLPADTRLTPRFPTYSPSLGALRLANAVALLRNLRP